MKVSKIVLNTENVEMDNSVTNNPTLVFLDTKDNILSFKYTESDKDILCKSKFGIDEKSVKLEKYSNTITDLETGNTKTINNTDFGKSVIEQKITKFPDSDIIDTIQTTKTFNNEFGNTFTNIETIENDIKGNMVKDTIKYTDSNGVVNINTTLRTVKMYSQALDIEEKLESHLNGKLKERTTNSFTHTNEIYELGVNKPNVYHFSKIEKFMDNNEKNQVSSVIYTSIDRYLEYKYKMYILYSKYFKDGELVEKKYKYNKHGNETYCCTITDHINKHERSINYSYNKFGRILSIKILEKFSNKLNPKVKFIIDESRSIIKNIHVRYDDKSGNLVYIKQENLSTGLTTKVKINYIDKNSVCIILNRYINDENINDSTVKIMQIKDFDNIVSDLTYAVERFKNSNEGIFSIDITE